MVVFGFAAAGIWAGCSSTLGLFTLWTDHRFMYEQQTFQGRLSVSSVSSIAHVVGWEPCNPHDRL